MKYKGKEIEVLSHRRTFGKKIVKINILSSGEIIEVPESEIEETSASISIHEIMFKAIAARIKNEVFHQKMLAPLESNIIPLPHQILALEKVMSGEYLRFLIADEVGMGKTIETGLILKELKLRGVVNRTLVIVPKSAMLQWKLELKKHFNENFHIYDSEYILALTKTFSQIEADNEINIWSQHNQLIVSMDSLKPLEKRKGWSREKIDEYNRYRIQSVLEAEFDLLVLDECHKVGGSSLHVGRYQMADILCNAIPNVLLLSATPHRGKSDHFRRILQLLDKDAFMGEGAPEIKELEPFVVRTEKRQAIDYNGQALFNKRKTEKIEVPYNPSRHSRQQMLYEDVSEYVVKGFNLSQQNKDNSYGFVMILFQRMMSSSTQAILDAMEKRATKLGAEKERVSKESILENYDDYDINEQMEFDFEAKINTIIEETKACYDTELEELQKLIRNAKDCLNSEIDVKIEFLIEKLRELKEQEGNPDLKFILFTEFTGTQNMLKEILSKREGYVCETINGSMEFEKRIEALKNFKGSSQILISTDAAGESLNMQFAYIVINYDMPWNPMVVEQRIGRVDRIGQQHEVIAINLLLDNSVDKRVYEVIEIKLNQILQELGIDKTSDVLDSTIEREEIKNLYLSSLLDPRRFEKESENWLEKIKDKLKSYQSTEGSLPITNSKNITVEKTNSVKHSPLPKWLEILSIQYLKTNTIPYKQLIDSIKFQYPGRKEQVYTFDIKESINNPIPEPLSLQHEIIQDILSNATPFNHTHRIPVIKLMESNVSSGFWSLWHLEVKNKYISEHIIEPIFISTEGDTFIAYAQDLWRKLCENNEALFHCKDSLSEEKTKEIMDEIEKRQKIY